MKYPIYLDRIKRIVDKREERFRKFWDCGNHIPIVCKLNAPRKMLTLGFDLDKEKMFKNQLSLIEDMLSVNEDYLPFLCPWYGVGLYAEAFGCQTEYFDDKEPWTRPIVKNAEEAKRLEPLSIEKSPMMRMVLDTIEYFQEETKGLIPIAFTDTQSPLDTAMIIWEQSDFFESFYESPEVLHKLLTNITDVIISFSKKQIELIGERNTCCPGIHMFNKRGGTVLDVSDDILDLISSDIVEGFDKPYMEKIARELGGIAIHSCGKIDKHFQVLKNYSRLYMLNFKISPSEANSPETVKDNFKNTGIYINLDLESGFDPDWNKYNVKGYGEYITEYILPRLHHRNLRYIVNFQASNESEAKIFYKEIRKRIVELQDIRIL